MTKVGGIREQVAAGDVDGALESLQGLVRKQPAEGELRVVLFELLCIRGDWQRALTQLNVAAELDASTLLMVQAYREVLQCEQFREAVFEGTRSPLFLGQPPDWLAALLQALPLAAAGQGAAAMKVAESAFEQAPTTRGTWREHTFEWLSDADMRLGPVVEAIVDGRYYWIPMSAVSRIELSSPEDLRDLVWLPATFQWVNEGSSNGFMPSRYPLGHDQSQPAGELLARVTDWDDLGDGYYVGRGQRMLASEKGEFALLEGGEIVFEHEGGEEAHRSIDG